MLFLLAKWLGIHRTRVYGPTSNQSALLEALTPSVGRGLVARVVVRELHELSRSATAQTGRAAINITLGHMGTALSDAGLETTSRETPVPRADVLNGCASH